MSANLDKIRAQLRALRARTVDNGCTEAEAMAAAEKMAELLSRHGLTDTDLDADEYDECQIEIGRRSPLAKVWRMVALFADCTGWYDRTSGKSCYCYFGRPGDVLVAEYVHGVMADACARAVKEFRATEVYRRRRTPKTRAAAVRAFHEALAASLERKLSAGLWRRYGGDTSPDQVTTALRLYHEKLKAASQQGGRVFHRSRALMKAEGKFKDAAHRAGFRAGDRIEIHAGVAAGNKISGVLT